MAEGEAQEPGADVRGSARGWHQLQVFVLGFIGLCGVLQRGCDRLWGRDSKACQFVFVFEGLLTEPTGTLTRSVADHFTQWMLNPPGVVYITANIVRRTDSGFGFPQEQEGQATGSGFVIDSDGYILTNDHVVANGSRYTVTLSTGATLTAHVVGTDPNDDLAMVKIAAQHLPTATLGNSAALQVGQSVVVLGNPLGIVDTATGGIVSALHRTVSEGMGGGQILDAIQTNAAI